MPAVQLAITASRDEDYERLGISRDRIAPWEDGARTDARPGTYEWWYFDAHLDDGAKLVVIFMDKNLTTPKKPLTPMIQLNLDLPDGRSFTKYATFEPGQYSAATDGADVRIGENRFVGDLHTYRITVKVDGITVDATLTGTVPPWRPETGFTLFGKNRKREFSWLPSVPQGTVDASYTVDGQSRSAKGVGYHDHNWGNVGLIQIIHDWYWARGQAGPYSTVTSFVTAHRRYGYTQIPIFMLARDGTIVADDATNVSFEREGVYIDRTTGKPVAQVTRYTYRKDNERYVVTYTRDHDLSTTRMIEGTHGLKRIAARLARFDGAYLRFTGECRVQHFIADTLVDDFADPAIWELMYFGHAR